MKNFDSIYESIKDFFYSTTKLDIAIGSTIDFFTLAISKAIEKVYKAIEDAKNPHIFTKLQGNNIDSMGILVGCHRQPEEKDDSFLYRMVNWNTSNQASNSIAIETALMNMTYVSNAKHVPLTQGVGTATVYIIPKKMDENTIKLAIDETKERLEKVISKGSFINYVVPKILPINIIAYISIQKDEDNVKFNIAKKIEEYINNIAPGEILEVGNINKIGINEPNVNYFSVSDVIINGKEMQDIKAVQKLEEKFLFNNINWKMVVNE